MFRSANEQCPLANDGFMAAAVQYYRRRRMWFGGKRDRPLHKVGIDLPGALSRVVRCIATYALFHCQRIQRTRHVRRRRQAGAVRPCYSGICPTSVKEPKESTLQPKTTPNPPKESETGSVNNPLHSVQRLGITKDWRNQLHQLTGRRLSGLLIVLIGTVISFVTLGASLGPWNQPMQDALQGGLMAAGATALGTLPVLYFQGFSQRIYDAMLGFGAGVMLAASSFSLVIPALTAATQMGASQWIAGGKVGVGILLGAGLLLMLDRLIPHEHFVKGLEGRSARALKRVWLFVFAISLHNLPEGLAIGVATAGSDPVGAIALTTGISIQDVPEGMVVALALRSVGYGKWTSSGAAILSGLVEPIAAVFGAAVVSLSAHLLPWGLAMAAGAMLFVISHEIIPESHRKGHEALATSGLMLGFVVMMVLDTALA